MPKEQPSPLTCLRRSLGLSKTELAELTRPQSPYVRGLISRRLALVEAGLLDTDDFYVGGVLRELRKAGHGDAVDEHVKWVADRREGSGSE